MLKKSTISLYQHTIKIGTLNSILREVSHYVGITKEELIKNLFG